MTVLAILFWVCAGLLVYTHVGYPIVLVLLARLRRAPGAAATMSSAGLPSVSVVVAAYAEQEVIAPRIENLRALDYPAECLQLIVACDGSPDDTAARARAAGADMVLELPRGGKIRAQDAGVEHARGELIAFSDANAMWEPDALRCLIAAFADPRVGYACGAGAVRQRARLQPGGRLLAL